MALSYADNPQVQKNRWRILTAVGLFTFMATLDGSIVNIALPVMSRDLKIPMNQSEWIVSIYLIMICALLLLFGKVGDAFGKVKVFKIGTFLFVLGSLLCGFNGGLPLLLGARVVQALGASMTMSNNNGIITEVFPLKERGRALGLTGSFVALGSIAGPGIGGLILAHFSWGYIFWINVPIGILTIIFGHFILPKDIIKTHEKIDYAGFVSFAALIVSLFLGIFIGQQIGFTSPIILTAFVVALISPGIFVWIEQHVEQPLLSFRLFKNVDFSLSLLCAFLIFIVNFFFNVISPFYLENALGLAPNLAGYSLMIFPIVQVVVAPIAGSISDKIGPELLTFVGLGNGIFQAPNNTIVMSSVGVQDLGVAGGINALARNLVMVFGISLSTTVLYAAMSRNYGQKVTGYIPGHADVFIAGMHDAFMVALVICLIATALTGWRMLKHRH